MAAGRRNQLGLLAGVLLVGALVATSLRSQVERPDCECNTLDVDSTSTITPVSCDTDTEKLETDDNGLIACGTIPAAHGDGANCLAGEIPLGVDATGAVQGCYEPTEADISDLSHVHASDGANCTVGNYPLGVDTAGAVQSCTALDNPTGIAGLVQFSDGASGHDSNALLSVNEDTNASFRVESETDLGHRIRLGPGGKHPGTTHLIVGLDNNYPSVSRWSIRTEATAPYAVSIAPQGTEYIVANPASGGTVLLNKPFNATQGGSYTSKLASNDYIAFASNISLSGAGTTCPGTATTLTRAFNIVTTVGTGANNKVILEDCTSFATLDGNPGPGSMVVVSNQDSADSLGICPPSAGNFVGLADDTHVTIAAGSVGICWCQNASTEVWFCISSTALTS